VGFPITGGTPSGDVAVVALAHGDALECSGTLVAPHAVLTAAHCVSGSQLPDVAIGDALSGAVRHAAFAAFVHPEFSLQTLDHDIAVLVIEPVTGPTLSIATSLSVQPGATMRIVGFGWTVANDTSPALRHTGTSRIDAVDELRIVSSGAPEQACEGDSGGPSLFDSGDGEQIVGVASSGDTTCTIFAKHTRVDIHGDFVLGAIARSGVGAANAGDRCWYATNCAVGACLPARDEPRISFCAPACDGGKCPGNLECVTIDGEPRCVHEAPSPGAEGARCASDSECAGSLCLAPAGDSHAVCTQRCFSDLPGFPCPGDETCRDATGGGEACFAVADDGGCRATRGNGFALALLSLGFVVQLLRGRGRP
jgi:hypothetical protein